MELKTAVRTGLALILVMSAGVSMAGTTQPEHKTEFRDMAFLHDEEKAIERLSAEWARALNAHEPLKVASLYDEEFILYATLKTKVHTEEELLAYFSALTKKQAIKVSFTEQNIRVHGPTAINSGLYTFSYMENGDHVELPARFTFVFVLTPTGWMIVDHHSSVLPE